MPETIVVSHTVPGTSVVISVVRKEGLLNHKVCFLATREIGTTDGDFVNYLQCGRDTEQEARKEANFLWTDTVTRRDRARF